MIMKFTILTIIAIMFISGYVLGQSLSDLTDSAKGSTSEMEYIYDLDVFGYFHLEDYDTKLKQAVFKKTEEYQNKMTELKGIRAEMLKTTYYGKLTDVFSRQDYDIKRKGFEIELGMNWGIGTFSARTPKSIYLENGCTILLKALPSKQVAAPIIGKGVIIEKLFLAMSEESGLEIENDKENIELYFFFIPSGKEKSVFQYYNAVNNSFAGWYTMTHNDLKADNVRVVVANKSSGKIIYDKFYTYKTLAPKK